MLVLKLFYAWIPAILLFVYHVVFACIPGLVMRVLGLKKAARKWVTFNSALIADAALFLLGTRIHVSGDTEALRELMKKDAKICYIANHTSMMDIPLVEGPLAMGCGFVIKKGVAYVPLVNIVAFALHSVFLDRTSLKKSAAAIKRGVKSIENGNSMLIFPEGTRSKTGKIADFKHGSFKLASMSGAVVVPVTIKGIRETFEDRKHVFQRVDCYLNVGTPEPTETLTRTQMAELEERVEAGIKTCYESLGRN